GQVLRAPRKTSRPHGQDQTTGNPVRTQVDAEALGIYSKFTTRRQRQVARAPHPPPREIARSQAFREKPDVTGNDTVCWARSQQISKARWNHAVRWGGGRWVGGGIP